MCLSGGKDPDKPSDCGAVQSCGFHKQEKGNSCVIASSRNIIEEKTGKDVPEDELRDDMRDIMGKPDHDFDKDGINPVHAQKLLKKHGVDSTKKKGLSPKELEALTKKEGPVMVGFKKPGHRVILDSVETDDAGKKVYKVKDPASKYGGKTREMSEEDFGKRYNDKAIVIVPD